MNRLSAKIEELIKRSVDNGDIAGANILVLKKGNEAAYADFGYADIESKKPVQRDTLFRLYSQTKPVTAAAAMLLVSRGVIDLSADIADYLPEFAEQYVNIDGNRKIVQRRITVRDLMNMTSGIPYPDDSSEGGKQSGRVFWEICQRMYGDNPVTTKEFSEKMAENDLVFQPGERFMYGASADIMGALIERVTGTGFRDFLMKNFFVPLQMKDTDFYVPKEKQCRLAKAYDYGENGLKECVTDHLGLRYNRDVIPAFQSGGAGLCSTVDDYGKFAAMLINGGEYGGKQIISRKAVEYLTGCMLPEEKLWQYHQWWDWLSGYSYGNFMRVCKNENEVSLISEKGEYGWDGWLGTFFSNEPKSGISLIMGVQQVGVGRSGTLVRKVKNYVMSELV